MYPVVEQDGTTKCKACLSLQQQKEVLGAVYNQWEQCWNNRKKT